MPDDVMTHEEENAVIRAYLATLERDGYEIVKASEPKAAGNQAEPQGEARNPNAVSPPPPLEGHR